ncbi:MAG TPA: acyl-CoA dehydrogenase family protein [Solirubrobacteraceae bacterium]|jgi:acyl-CoA dehydrogenase
MTVTVESDRVLLADVARIAAEVAAPAAEDVDRDARFPSEAVAALREVRALSAAVPEELGGGGATLEAIARCCYELGRCCSSAAMVFAMHQIQVVTIVRHLDGAPWFDSYLRRLAAEQRLVASVTSEVGTGGDMARSIAAVTEERHDVRAFEKQAPTVSYGAHADDLFTTVRRHGDAEPGDQVLVLSTAGQAELEPTGVWNTLGMRGTCSPGFVVRARFAPEQILPAPFSSVMNQSLVPVSHILWSHVWLGIATEAFERARAFVRASARQRPGEPLPAAHRLSNVMAELTLLRSEVAQALADFTSDDEDGARERLLTMASVLRFNNLKLAASEHTPRVCEGALEVIGILGYRNDGPYSVGRHLRDALSARLMVANERIHATDAALLLIAKEA